MADLLLADVTCKMGKLNGSYIYDLTFVDIVDLKVYMCVVDSTYRNYTRSHWDVIVNGQIPYGLYTGLRKTARTDKDGLSVISADSMPQLVEPMSESEVTQVIETRRDQLFPQPF